MRKVIIGLILVAVALSGCGGPPKKTAQEIAWAALEAVAKIESYVFDSATNVAMTAMAPQSGEMNVAFRGDGAVNNARREMRMKAAVRWEALEEGETTALQEEEMEIYLLGGMTYMKATLLGMPTEWVKTQTPPGYWESLSPTEQRIELLEGAAVELLGEERVDGVDSYRLRATPNLEKLWQMMMQELGQTGIEAERPDLGQVIKSFSVLYWIAKDTSFVTKVDTQMTLVMVSQEIGLPQEEGEPQVQEFQVQVEMSVSSRFSRYNQPVSIVLPPEAEGAVGVPSEE